MARKIAAIAFIILIPLLLNAQGVKEKSVIPTPVKEKPAVSTPVKEKSETINMIVPVQAQYSDNFKIEKCYFNKRIDGTGKGEVMEVEMVIKNLTDTPMDIYLFVICTFEKTEKTKSSFEMPIPFKERLRNFVPYPNDIKNFEYENVDKKPGISLLKYPKNPKAGTDPETNKPYTLKNKLLVRTYHLSPYRANYVFFNNVTILIFDGEGKPAYKETYIMTGTRNR
jgi:hypothetical protein